MHCQKEMDSMTDDRVDTRYLQLALCDSLLANSSYEDAVEVLEHLLMTETNNASVVLKATIRLSKAQRRMGEIFPSSKITAVLSQGIKVLDKVDGDLLSVFVEETMCNVSRVDTSEAPQSLDDMMVGYSTVRAAVLRIRDRIQEIIQNNLPKSGYLALSNDALDSTTDSLERLETYLQRAVSNRQEVDDDNIRSMAEVFQKILGISLSENRSDTFQSSAEVQNITNSAFGGEVQSSSPRNNVLILDGGGVRTLSSLVILEKLMQFINDSVWKQSSRSSAPLEPYQVFELVAGSGTGGMIAIMLGKLGMSLDQCRTTFIELVVDILSQPILRGPAIAGLKWTRYRGAELQQWIRATLQKVCGNPDLLMSENLERATTDCTVVYKVHVNKLGYSDFEPEPGYICSGPCLTSGSSFVRDALYATLASPTMFPAQKIGGRLYTDGGMEFNNPSYAIFDHCIGNSRVELLSSAVELPAIHHRTFGSSPVRLVNLGSGTKFRASISLSSLPFFEKISRFSFRRAVSMNNLSKTSVISENTARHMESIARVSQKMNCLINYKYERFSDNDSGVFSVKADSYKELGTIETMTWKYVNNPKIEKKLQRVGEEIARDYLQKQQVETGVPIQKVVSGLRN